MLHKRVIAPKSTCAFLLLIAGLLNMVVAVWGTAVKVASEVLVHLKAAESNENAQELSRTVGHGDLNLLRTAMNTVICGVSLCRGVFMQIVIELACANSTVVASRHPFLSAVDQDSAKTNNTNSNVCTVDCGHGLSICLGIQGVMIEARGCNSHTGIRTCSCARRHVHIILV